jgi:lipopolysaccharide export LptBFGC system permease protein LptF
MRYFPALLFVAALACFGFSYWGLNTISGRATFDEMAGMIPLAATPVGLLLLLCAAVLLWRRRKP